MAQNAGSGSLPMHQWSPVLLIMYIYKPGPAWQEQKDRFIIIKFIILNSIYQITAFDR
jgi:hypothetical protein